MSTAADSAYGGALRRLYLARFVFAAIWVALVLATGAAGSSDPTVAVTALLVVYPLVDAGAVWWQMRRDPDPDRSTTVAWINVVVSVTVALGLGVVSSTAIPTAVAVWGGWAIASGVPQLITAIRNRRTGGQVAQMISGGLSAVAGLAFLLQGIQGNGAMIGAVGYAGLGGIFFLVSAIRLRRPAG